MKRPNLKEIRIDMLRDECGSASSGWLSIGMAILLFFVMTKLEGLIYVHTGGGFLLP